MLNDVGKETSVSGRSRDKLKRDIEREIMKHIDHTLDISEVAVGEVGRYKAFRSKILRSGNDAIREIKKILERDYEVNYIPSKEDIIEVQHPGVSVRRVR